MRRTSRPSGSPVAARSAISCSSSSLRGARTGPCRRPRCLGAERATGAKLLTARHGPLLPRAPLWSGRCPVDEAVPHVGPSPVLGRPLWPGRPSVPEKAEPISSMGVDPGLNGHRLLIAFRVVARGLHFGRSQAQAHKICGGAQCWRRCLQPRSLAWTAIRLRSKSMSATGCRVSVWSACPTPPAGSRATGSERRLFPAGSGGPKSE